MRWITLLALATVWPVAAAGGQTRADTAAIDSILLASVVRDRPGLTLTVIVRDFHPDQAVAIIIWSRCTTRTGFLNAWTHEFHLKLRKEATGWVGSPYMYSIGDGHC